MHPEPNDQLPGGCYWLERLKVTFTVVATSTGLPFSSVGWYTQCRTASIAAGASIGSGSLPNWKTRLAPLKTFSATRSTCFTVPSVAIHTLSCTTPVSPFSRASGGYTGGGWRTNLACCTAPSTWSTTRCGPSKGQPGGGGGGGGGGAASWPDLTAGADGGGGGTTTW